jgi:hypothetical protein
LNEWFGAIRSSWMNVCGAFYTNIIMNFKDACAFPVFYAKRCNLCEMFCATVETEAYSQQTETFGKACALQEKSPVGK